MKETYVFTTAISVEARSLNEAVKIFLGGMAQPWVHDNVVESTEDGNGEVNDNDLFLAQKAFYENIVKVKKHSIPLQGYGWGAAEYGHTLSDAIEELEVGVEYIAKIETGIKPDDWLDDESFPSEAKNLVLEKRVNDA